MIHLNIHSKLLALRTGLLRRLPLLRRGSSISGVTASAHDAAANCSPLSAPTGAAAPSAEGPSVMIVRAAWGYDPRLACYLEQAGLQVLQAETIVEAAPVLSRSQVRLVLLDLQDGGDDGTRIILQLQQEAGRPRIPMIVLTPRTDSEARVAALLAGADDCLAKPASLEEVLARVRAVLRWSPGVGPRFVPAALAPVL
jgi:CheY-like chemotaxis protein